MFFKKIIVERFDEILEPILLLMSHEEEDVRRAALSANDLLMQNIQMINKELAVNFAKVMPLLKEMLSEKKSSSTSESALRWMKFML
jgi:vacuole morphology and inheritance protein 14